MSCQRWLDTALELRIRDWHVDKVRPLFDQGCKDPKNDCCDILPFSDVAKSTGNVFTHDTPQTRGWDQLEIPSFVPLQYPVQH